MHQKKASGGGQTAEKPHASVNQSKQSIANPYEEEESYENPVNISKAPGCQDSLFDIRSEYANAGASVNISQDEAIVQISNLQIDDNAQDSYAIA